MVSIVEAVIISVCVVCFVFNSLGSMEKFIKKQTTLAVSEEGHPAMRLPAITICNMSGFNNDRFNSRQQGMTVQVVEHWAMNLKDLGSNPSLTRAISPSSIEFVTA